MSGPVLGVHTLPHVLLQQPPRELVPKFTEGLIHLHKETLVAREKQGFKRSSYLSPNPLPVTLALFSLSIIKNVI